MNVLLDINQRPVVGVYPIVMSKDVNYVSLVMQVNVKYVGLEHSYHLSEIVLHVMQMAIVRPVEAPLYVTSVRTVDT